MSVTTVAEESTRTIPLRPVKGNRDADWSLTLDDHMLTLTAPDSRVVMMLPREDAVNHVRFLWDVLRGPVLLLEVVPGLKGYHFRNGPNLQDTLLEWLPQRSNERVAREIRAHGAFTLLFTLILFQFPHLFPTRAVAIANLAGILLVAWPLRRVVPASASALVVAGGLLLYHAAFTAGLENVVDNARAYVTASGALLLLWGIQQVAIMSANHRLEAARSEHPDSTAFPQPLSARVWYVTGGACLLVATLLGGVLWRLFATGQPHTAEIALHAAPMLATLGMAIILFFRAGRGLLEAKLSVQWLIVVLVVLAYGLLHGDPDPNASVVQTGLRHLSRAHVWLTAVALILGFNAAFRYWLSRQLRAKPGKAEAKFD